MADAKPEKRVAGTPAWDKYAKGIPTDLSGEQRELVATFLSRCPPDRIESMRFPLEPRDFFACRVLRARKFVVDDALKLVEETSAWREAQNMKTLCSRDASEILGCYEDELQFFYQKGYFPTRDKEGRPIYVERAGVVDVDAMLVLTDIDHLVDYHIYANETQMVPLFAKASQEAGRPITTMCAIVDMGGMTLKLSSATTRSYITRMIGIDSKHYPETLGRMFLINVPSIFSLAWALIQPFLDERTQRKIEIISSPDAWKKRLREVIDEGCLPVEYGGKLVVPGGIFPPSRTKRFQVAAGKSFYDVTAAVPRGTSMRFKWFCRPGDMRFSVRFIKGVPPPVSAVGAAPMGEVGVDLYPKQVHPGSDKKCVVATVTAPGDGYFVAAFDNVQGWYQREVFYRADIVKGASSESAAAGGGGGASAPASAAAAGGGVAVATAPAVAPQAVAAAPVAAPAAPPPAEAAAPVAAPPSADADAAVAPAASTT